MMLAKVISVQLVSMLGYDLLFSDVDVVWFKDPLEYFNGPNSSLKEHDLIFQDDGSRTLRYAPVSGMCWYYGTTRLVQHFSKCICSFIRLPYTSIPRIVGSILCVRTPARGIS